VAVAGCWVHLGGVPPAWTYSLPGAVVVLSLLLYPLSMLTTEVALRRLAPRMEEAALTVAAPGRVLRGITLPLVAPAVAAAALVVFVLAASEFGVPALLRVRVFTAEIFTAFAALYDFRRATALALPLLALALLAAFATLRLLGDRLLVTRRSGAGPSLVVPDEWVPRGHGGGTRRRDRGARCAGARAGAGSGCRPVVRGGHAGIG